MELTLDEALKKGIEAHKAGQVQDAEKLYAAILKTQPNHPDANHNMGVLVAEVGKIHDALPFFKTALESQPSPGQHWLSYIDALTKLNQISEAKSVLNQAKTKGMKGGAFHQLEKSLFGTIINRSNLQDPPPEKLQAIMNLYAQGKLKQALSESNQALKMFPNSAYLLNVVGASNVGLMQFDAAIVSYKRALQVKPDYADVYNNMGIALKAKGDLGAAIDSYQRALLIKPDYAAAYNNIGLVLNSQGDLEASINSYKQALKIEPNYAAAYNNMGLAMQDKDDLEAAIDCYKHALKIQPNHEGFHYNLANALADKGDIEAAIGSYERAIKIKPDYAEAYNNMGSVLKKKGDLDLAIGSYEKALEIMPDYAEAYYNIGNVQQHNGNLEAAINNYKHALKFKPDDAKVWDSLEFPLQAMKLQSSTPFEFLSNFLPQTNFKQCQIARSILNFSLHLGGKNAESALNEACSLLARSDNRIIKNPAIKNNERTLKVLGPEQIFALVHFGRSGTGLLHSLIDGHPQVSTMPSIYFSEFFNHSNWGKIVEGGWNEMINQFVATYEVLFDASVQNPIESKSHKFIEYLGQKEGMANVGNQRDEVLRVDKILFCEELKRLMDMYDHLDTFTFFKLAHAAYNKSLKDYSKKHLILYHIHNPHTYTKLNFVNAAPNANWIMMVREPLQACESWIKDHFHNNEHLLASTAIVTMLFEIDNVVYHKQNAIGVRLEDLKEFPKKTIPALCDWMGIKELESLYAMTAQGKKWWGDPASRDYSKDGMEPFGKVAIRRKLGLVFSRNDQFILRTLFYPFSVNFSYVEENLEQFKVDLNAIRPMLDEMFDFEKVMVKRKQLDRNQFMKSGSYLYLRSGLIGRWNVLAEFHTYPNMIKRLKIN